MMRSFFLFFFVWRYVAFPWRNFLVRLGIFKDSWSTDPVHCLVSSDFSYLFGNLVVAFSFFPDLWFVEISWLIVGSIIVWTNITAFLLGRLDYVTMFVNCSCSFNSSWEVEDVSRVKSVFRGVRNECWVNWDVWSRKSIHWTNLTAIHHITSWLNNRDYRISLNTRCSCTRL